MLFPFPFGNSSAPRVSSFHLWCDEWSFHRRPLRHRYLPGARRFVQEGLTWTEGYGEVTGRASLLQHPNRKRTGTSGWKNIWGSCHVFLFVSPIKSKREGAFMSQNLKWHVETMTPFVKYTLGPAKTLQQWTGRLKTGSLPKSKYKLGYLPTVAVFGHPPIPHTKQEEHRIKSGESTESHHSEWRISADDCWWKKPHTS